MNRLLSTVSAATLLALAGCQTTSTTTAVTPAQVAADLTGLVTTLQGVETALATTNVLPAAQATTLANDLANAQKALANLSAGLPAVQGASVAQQIDQYLNDVVDVLAAIPNPYSAEIGAAAVILPTVEAFVNQYLPGAAPVTAARVGAAAAGLTSDAARKMLHIPVVHS